MLTREQLRTVRKIQIRTSHLVSDLFAGQYQSVFKGRGMEFAEVRLYQPGDDVRTIDWNVTARTSVPHVKRYAEERELTVMLLVDASASTQFGSVAQLKSTLAAELAALLAFSAITNNDKVGLVIFSDRIELAVPPRKGTRHVLRVIREVLSLKPAGRGTDIPAALEHLAKVTKRRCVVFLVSDFLDPRYKHALRVAGRRHDVIAVVLDDPRESELPAVGLVELEEAETGTRYVLDTGDARVREAFARQAAVVRADRDRTLRAAEVDAIPVRTDRPYADALLRFFRMRERRAATSASSSRKTLTSPPVEVHARAEPDTVTVGQRFRYSVEVKADAGVDVVFAQPTEHLGDFDIVDFGDTPAVQKGASTVVTRWFTLVGWTPGRHLIKSPPVRYRVPGGELTDLQAYEMGVQVDSLLEKTPDAADIRDIREPEPVPVDWRPYWVGGGALVLVVAGAAAVWAMLRRRTRPAVAAPPRPPHEVAAAALAALAERRLVEHGEFKELYSGLSDIVRTYLEQRFELRAPEMTTEEFLLTTARDGRLARAHRPLLSAFLTESDLVKFARHLPTLADAERAFAAARRFVDETAAAAAPGDRRAAG